MIDLLFFLCLFVFVLAVALLETFGTYMVWRGFDARFRTAYRFERAKMPVWMISMVKRFER